jgi:hypothetical protein
MLLVCCRYQCSSRHRGILPQFKFANAKVVIYWDLDKTIKQVFVLFDIYSAGLQYHKWQMFS